MKTFREKIESQLSKVADDLDMDAGKRLKLESNQIHGYYFRVFLKEESKLRNNKKYTIFESSKSGIKFRNTRVENYNDQYLETKKKYENAQMSIVTEITSVAGKVLQFIKLIIYSF